MFIRGFLIQISGVRVCGAFLPLDTPHAPPAVHMLPHGPDTSRFFVTGQGHFNFARFL